MWTRREWLPMESVYSSLHHTHISAQLCVREWLTTRLDQSSRHSVETILLRLMWAVSKQKCFSNRRISGLWEWKSSLLFPNKTRAKDVLYSFRNGVDLWFNHSSQKMSSPQMQHTPDGVFPGRVSSHVGVCGFQRDGRSDADIRRQSRGGEEQLGDVGRP